MNEARIDLLREWPRKITERGILFSYPAPENAKGFYPYGFVRKNDSAANLVGWYGLFLDMKKRQDGSKKKAADAAEREPQSVVISIRIFFDEDEALEKSVTVLCQDSGIHVEIPFSCFPLEQAKGNRWEFVTAVEIGCDCEDMELAECTIRHRPGVYVHMPVKGLAGDIGETLCYRGTVYNCASEALAVTADQVFEGWESLMAGICLGEEYRESASGEDVCCEKDGQGSGRGMIVLGPGEAAALSVSVTVHDYMVPGGHENTRIRVSGQGSRGLTQDGTELKTLRRLPHPYLYHNADGWKKVMENAGQYKPYAKALRECREAADAWVVTGPLEKRLFCYETKTETCVMSAAYLYALTGEEGYGRKLADFFRRFSDSADGYPARKRGCSQSYVQEGHFFKHLAIAYDILYDSGLLDREEKAAVEKCFRLYMEMLDVHILSGHISNWILSELQGALFCALTLQDMDRALRFTFGSGGIIEQFRCGIFNDGWWHECSVGYNTWVSSMMLHVAHALLPFGYNLVYADFQIPFNKEVSSTYRGEAPEVKHGMYNQKWGGNRRPSVCIKDMFDATLPFLDDRGVLFGISDSDEKKLSGVHFGSTYDLAFHYYHDSRYLPVIANNEVDFIFGEPQVHRQAVSSVEDTVSGTAAGREEYLGNACADNIGLALLRSKKPGRRQREQIQAVLRYGSHGNAHGHFDITELLSVMRYGRSFFNPENCWWGYAHFMYKFYVQCSLTKNMVVVDEKMQIPADSRRILWQSGRGCRRQESKSGQGGPILPMAEWYIRRTGRRPRKKNCAKDAKETDASFLLRRVRTVLSMEN